MCLLFFGVRNGRKSILCIGDTWSLVLPALKGWIMGEKKEKMYTHIMDAIEVVHRENLAIAKLLLASYDNKEAKEEMERITTDWQKAFDEIRSQGW